MYNFYHAIPKPIRKAFIEQMAYADVKDPNKNMGAIAFMTIILSIVSAIFVNAFLHIDAMLAILSTVAFYFIFQALFFAMISLKADGRGRMIENILPDALLLMSMNIRSGMTADHALIMSALPDFGPLEKELNKAGKQLLSGDSMREALLDMAKRIKSKQVDRTMRLIVEGVESGGEISNLLIQTAEDIQKMRLIQNEIKANVMMYAIFIFFAAGMGAPLLFGVSTYLVGALNQQFATLGSSSSSTSAFSIGTGAEKISPQFLTFFSLASLTVTSIFGGMMIGIVKGGSEKDGLKMIPMLFIISIGVFFVVRIVVSGILPVGR